MFGQEKYYSPSEGREIEYDEFKKYTCDQMSSIMDSDMAAFRVMLEKDPCKARKILNGAFYTYSRRLILDNFELYQCAVKPRSKLLNEIRKQANELTKHMVFEFEYSISSEVAIPFEKIIGGVNFAPITGENEFLKGVLIKNVHSDDMLQAQKLGERKLNQFLGYLALYSNELSTRVGQWEGSYTDVCGQSMMLVGTEPAGLKQIFWDQYATLDLEAIGREDFVDGAVLDLIFVAAYSEYIEMWRGAYLNFYLALEAIIISWSLDPEDFLKFKWIRNSITHAKLDTLKRKREPFIFLENEFGSELPDWDDADIQILLGNWTRKLRAELRRIVFG